MCPRSKDKADRRRRNMKLGQSHGRAPLEKLMTGETQLGLGLFVAAPAGGSAVFVAEQPPDIPAAEIERAGAMAGPVNTSISNVLFYPFDLLELQFDRGGATENRHADFHSCPVEIEFLDHAVEAGERACLLYT